MIHLAESTHDADPTAMGLSDLVFNVLQEGHQGNKRLSAFQLLHKNHENGL